MTYEGFRLKVLKIKRRIWAEQRKKKLKDYKFTIISNNCWGGMIYESYNIQKQSPTVGLFFMASDYIKFVKDLKGYLNCELEFIQPEESKWNWYFKKDAKFGTYPIGKLKDIEIFFLHYKTEEEVKEKWIRRCQRVNWDRILIKFNDQNDCNFNHVKEFIDLPYKNKIFFTCKEWEEEGNDCIIKINQLFAKDFIRASYEPFGNNKYCDLNRIINNL